MKKFFWICGGLSVALFATVLTVSLVGDSNTKKDVAEVDKNLDAAKAETAEKIAALETSLKTTNDTLDALIKSEVAKLNTAITEASDKLTALEKTVKEKDDELAKKIADEIKTVNSAIDVVKADLAKAATKTEMAEAIKNAKEELTTTINGVADRVTALETASEATKAEVSTLKTTVADLGTEVEAIKADYVTSAALTEKINAAVEDLKTGAIADAKAAAVTEAYQKVLDNIDTICASNNESINAKIDELNNVIYAATEDEENVTAWDKLMADFASESMINAKAVEVANFYGTCNDVKDELADLLVKLYGEDTTQIDAEYKTISTNIDTAYQKGIVRISLANDKTDLDATVKAVKDEVNELVEGIRVSVYKNSIESSFTKYVDAKLAAIVGMDLDTEAEKTYSDAINAVKLAPYAELETSSEVKNVLLNAMYEVYHVYAKASVDDYKIKACAKVATLENLVVENTEEGAPATDVKSYQNAINKVVLTDAYADIARQDNPDVTDDVTNVETNEAIHDEVTAVKTKVDALVQLATNQDKETAAYNAYLTERFTGPAEPVEESTLYSRYLEAANIAIAKKAYEDVMNSAKYDYAATVEVTDAAALVATYEAEVNELKAAIAKYEDAWKLAFARENSAKQFKEYKDGLIATFDGLTRLSDAEKATYTRMVNLVELPDVSGYESIEDIGKIYNEKKAHVDNVATLANYQNDEYGFISDAKAKYVVSEYLKQVDSDATLAAIDKIAKDHKYYVEDVADPETMEDKVLLDKVVAYKAETIKADYEAQEAELADLIYKADKVINTRKDAQKMVNEINDYSENYGEAVANDLSYELKLSCKDLVDSNSDFKLGDFTATKEQYDADSKAYLDGIKDVLVKSQTIHGATVKAAQVIAAIEATKLDSAKPEKDGYTSGLTQAEINKYIEQVYTYGYGPNTNEGTMDASELYAAMTADGADMNAVRDTYVENITAVKDAAEVVYSARIKAYDTHLENIEKIVKVIDDNHEFFNKEGNATTFTDAEWKTLTDKANGLLATHASNKCKTVEEVDAKNAALAEAITAWENEVKDQYKVKDAQVLAKTIKEETDKFEEEVLKFRKDYMALDIEILGLRKEYKERMAACEYSFKVASVHAEGLAAIKKLVGEEVAA